MSNNIPKICPACGAPVIEKSGISQKTGKRFHLWGCQNFPNCRYVYRETLVPKPPGFQKAVEEKDQGETILRGLREIYIKLDSLEKEFREFAKIFGNKQE